MLLFFAKFVVSQRTFGLTYGQGAADCFSMYVCRGWLLCYRKTSVPHQPDVVSNRVLNAIIRCDTAAQTVTIVIKVEEPIYLTLQAGEADGYEQEIRDLRAELVQVRRRLEESYAQLADKGGALEAAQAMLAEAHDALTIQRQMTVSLKEKIRTDSGVPSLLPTSGSNVGITGGEGALVARTLSGAVDETIDGAVHDTKYGADPSADPAAASPNVGPNFNRMFRETQSTTRQVQLSHTCYHSSHAYAHLMLLAVNVFCMQA